MYLDRKLLGISNAPTNKLFRNKDFTEIIYPDYGGSEISPSKLLTVLFLQPMMMNRIKKPNDV
jgi:hypothetical protein